MFLLPIICFLIIFAIFRHLRSQDIWRHTFLIASMVWGGMVVLITELLSVFRAITYWGMLLSWGFVVMIGVIILWRLGYSGIVRKALPRFPDLSLFQKFLFAGVGLIIVIVGITALIAPPNNFDSMTYHMSRVVHWIQNNSVENYPTHIPRQLYQNPWSEYAILQFQTLSGNDRLANLVQWFSMVGSIIGVTLIAGQLGAGKNGQIFAAVLCATIPMGILQGSSTQNDYVTAYWLVCFVYFSLVLIKKMNVYNAFAVGLSLGLAVLTKSTAYVYAIPFCVWVGLFIFRSYPQKWFRIGSFITIILLVINMGHYFRNLDLYGTPLGPNREGQFKFSNDVYSISSLISNSIRNISLHLGTSNNDLNRSIENKIREFHMIIGIHPDDPRTTWLGQKFSIPSLNYHEDTSGNLLHLCLVFISLPLIFFIPFKLRRQMIFYVVALLFTFIIFSFYLRWQPWHSRLHLPAFVLWCPVIGYLLSNHLTIPTSNVVLTLCIIIAFPWVFQNSSRTIWREENIFTISRIDQYFSNQPGLNKPYLDMAQQVEKYQCDKIGLVMGTNDWEYPLWVVLKKYVPYNLQIEHILVTNETPQKMNSNGFSSFNPCLIIDSRSQNPSTVSFNDELFLLDWSIESIGIYISDPNGQ